MGLAGDTANVCCTPGSQTGSTSLDHLKTEANAKKVSEYILQLRQSSVGEREEEKESAGHVEMVPYGTVYKTSIHFQVGLSHHHPYCIAEVPDSQGQSWERRFSHGGGGIGGRAGSGKETNTMGKGRWLLSPCFPDLSRATPLWVEESNIFQGQDDLIGAGGHLHV